MASTTFIKASNSSVESTVTKLLISTKQLLQVLTQWSKGIVTERTVSDAYVQLGNDLKIVSKFFKHLDIDVSDLVNVPRSLRKVLEGALREPPSEETLNKFLPTIRDIIVTLLDKLKVKQAELKAKKQNIIDPETQTHRKSASVISTISTTTSLGSVSNANSRSPSVLIGTSNSIQDHSEVAGNHMNSDNIIEQKVDVPVDNYKSPIVKENVSINLPPNSSDSNLGTQTDVIHNSVGHEEPSNSLHVDKTRTVSETNALLQLKNGSNLQRRASKRFSAYQMAKLTHQSNTDAALPPNLTSIASDDAIDLEREKTLSRLSSAASTVGNNEGAAIGNTASINGQSVEDKNKEVLFLKLGAVVKRYLTVIPSNINELRLLFVKVFAYSPKKNVFPDIYIKDPEFGVFYELDQNNFTDIRGGSVLELHVTNEDANNFNINEIINDLKTEINKNQQDLIDQVKNLSLNQSTELNMSKKFKESATLSSAFDMQQLREINQELSVLKKLRNEEHISMKSTIAKLIEKVELFKTVTLEGSDSTNRSYIENSQSNLGNVSDMLLSKVDDIQDVIEVLRKDVAIRGVKPSKKKLDAVFNELKEAEKELFSMQSFISTEKPTWKKIWESELDKVCEEQQFLTLQEDLAMDLIEDLKKVSETFDLVNLCCEEQEKYPKKIRTNPILPIAKPGTLHQTRDQLLVEVQSLVPDHEGRVDALEKAEKIWKREKDFKESDEFEDELETFVEKSSFKTSGGIEEIERIRKQKDEENLRAGLGII